METTYTAATTAKEHLNHEEAQAYVLRLNDAWKTARQDKGQVSTEERTRHKPALNAY
jgi:hypothetical protein